jgi:hypothetical protein
VSTTAHINPQAQEASVSASESIVREFCAEFNTPSTVKLLAYCEAGTIPWDSAEGLARKAMAEALASVEYGRLAQTV